MKNFSILALFIASSFSMSAQRATQYLSPVPSPQSFVSQNVGMTKITVSYSSPGMKGRKIFGELVPYGKEWRAGANSPTMLSFSTDVSVAGKTLRAGKYVVRMIPNKEGNWIVKLNLTNLEDRPPRLWKEGNKFNEARFRRDPYILIGKFERPNSYERGWQILNGTFSLSKN